MLHRAVCFSRTDRCRGGGGVAGPSPHYSSLSSASPFFFGCSFDISGGLNILYLLHVLGIHVCTYVCMYGYIPRVRAYIYFVVVVVVLTLTHNTMQSVRGRRTGSNN